MAGEMDWSGDILRWHRIRRGLTQAELGRLVGLSASAIGMYEQGRRIPCMETQRRLGELLPLGEPLPEGTLLADYRLGLELERLLEEDRRRATKRRRSG